MNINATIEDHWREFVKFADKNVTPDTNQYRIMRKTFYAAYGCALFQMRDLGGLEEDIAVTHLDRLHAEFAKFAADALAELLGHTRKN